GVEAHFVARDGRGGEGRAGLFAGEGEALQAAVGLVAPLLLIPVEVAVDHLVVAGSVARRAERRAHFEAALVADLAPAAADVRPGVVRFGVGDRLVVLVAETALEGSIGALAVRVVEVVAEEVFRDVRIVRVDDLAFAQQDVAVVGAVDRVRAAGRALRTAGREAVFDAG